MMQSTVQLLTNFLQEELSIPTADVSLAWQHSEQIPTLIPIVLWQYGLVTLAQLDRIFDWLQESYRSIELQALDAHVL